MALKDFFRRLFGLAEKKTNNIEYVCRKTQDREEYYCYRVVQGRYEEDGGPYATIEECEAARRERVS